MHAFNADQETPQSSGARARISNARSVTGCITCRKRRVKCDEHKPICDRCSKAGFSCLGYLEPNEAKPRTLRKRFRIIPYRAEEQQVASDDSRTPESVRSLSLSYSRSSFEEATINCFVDRILPGLQSYNRHLILWHTKTLHDLCSSTLLRDAIIAISLYHQLLESRKAEQKCLPSSRTIGLDDCPEDVSETSVWEQYYQRALRSLRDPLLNDWTLATLCCLFFTLLLSAQGRDTEAKVHLTSGIRLIGERDKSLDQRTRLEEELRMIFISLGISAWCHQPTKTLFNLLKTLNENSSDAQRLDGLAGLQARMHTLLYNVSEFAARVTARLSDVTTTLNDQRDQLLKTSEELMGDLDLVTQASDWQEDAHAKEEAIVVIPIMRARIKMLDILLRSLMSRYQSTYDRYWDSFREIVDLLDPAITWIATYLTPAQIIPPTVVYNTIPLLSQVACLCRHPIIRRTALHLLTLCPQREGLWDAKESYKAHKCLIEFEESCAERTTYVDGGLFIPEESRIHFIAHGATRAGSINQEVKFFWKPCGDLDYEQFWIAC